VYRARDQLAAVARQQGGVFSRRQALNAGYTARQIRYRLGTGQWRAPAVGVLCDATVEPREFAEIWARLLAAGSTAVLSHRSAARLWGLWAAPSPVDVTVRGGRTPRVAGAVVRRAVLPDGDVCRRAGLPVTCSARTVHDCLLTLPRPAARTLLDRALQQGLVTATDLRQRQHHAKGRWGAAQARRLLAELQDGSHSDGERRLARALRRRNVTGWVANLHVRLARCTAILDVAFEEARLAVEVDGWAWHSDVDRFQADRTRQNMLHLAGWTVLRFTWHDVAERPDHVVDVILAALRQVRDGIDH
jgi:very-short-patch-repair endonuclease